MSKTPAEDKLNIDFNHKVKRPAYTAGDISIAKNIDGREGNMKDVIQETISKSLWQSMDVPTSDKEWFEIKDNSKMKSVYNLQEEEKPQFSGNIAHKFQKEILESSLIRIHSDAKKQLEASSIDFYKLSKEEQVVYKKKRWQLVMQAHKDIGEILPFDRYNISFYGSFLNFMKTPKTNGYNTLPGDMDADADIAQFGTIFSALRKELFTGKRNMKNLRVTTTRDRSVLPIDSVLTQYTQSAVEMFANPAISDEEILSAIQNLDKKYHGAYRIVWDKGDGEDFEIENEIFFNKSGTGLTQLGGPESNRLTKIGKDTITVQLEDGVYGRFIDEFAQSRMYVSNLVEELDNNSVDAFKIIDEKGTISKPKVVKSAGRLIKLGQLNPNMPVYKLLIMLQKVRTQYLAAADLEYENMDPYLRAVFDEKIDKVVAFDEEAHRVIKTKLESENSISADISNIQDIDYDQIADVYDNQRNNLLKKILAADPKDSKDIMKELEGLDEDRDNTEYLASIDYRDGDPNPNSLSSKIVRFYKLMEASQHIIISPAEKKKIAGRMGIDADQRDDPELIVNRLSEKMRHLGEQHVYLQQLHEKDVQSGDFEDGDKSHYMEVQATMLLEECLELRTDLAKIHIMSVQKDDLEHFAIFSALQDLNFGYLHPIEHRITQLSKVYGFALI